MRLPHFSHTGMRLGAGTALASAILDQEADNFPDGRLYAESWTLVLFNLLCIGPLVYKFAESYASPKGIVRTCIDTFGMVLAHSGLYTLAHRCMHKVAALRPIHQHHHKFKTIVLPSSANSVSPTEFLWAYMLPFVIACPVISPSSSCLFSSTLIISTFNLMVHSPMLRSAKWPPWLVSPKMHLEHHCNRTAAYSAPTFVWRMPHLFGRMKLVGRETIAD